MKLPDLDRIRCEEPRTLQEFLVAYNKDLPETFTSATRASLQEFRDTHAEAFKAGEVWSLDLHRKKVMDWLRSRPA